MARPPCFSHIEAVQGFVASMTTNSWPFCWADLVRDLAWDLPALVIFRVLGIPDEDVARVKAGAESRLLLNVGATE
jgi:cytochrome P450